MKRSTIPVLVLATSTVFTCSSLGDDKPPERSETPAAVVAPAPEACAGYRDLSICLKNVYLHEEQSATTLSRLNVRDVEAGHEQALGYDLDWKEEKFTCTEMVLKPRTAVQEVCCYKVEPITTTDPITGKTCTVYQQVPDIQKVSVTTYELEPVCREHIVRVPCLKPVPQEMLVKTLAVDCTTVPAIESRLHGATIPCEAHVHMPACPLPCVPQ